METRLPGEDETAGVDALARRLRASTASEGPQRSQQESILPGSRVWLKSNPPPFDGSTPRRSIASTLRSRLYWLLLLALIPQLTQALAPRPEEEDSLRARIVRTLQAHPEVRARLAESQTAPTTSDLFELLPGHRLDGALFARDTWMHWAFALASG